MIKTAPHNAIDFTSSLNRIGYGYNVSVQRGYNYLSSTSAYLVFEYIPDVFGSEPTATLTLYTKTGSANRTQDHTVTLEDRFIFFFDLSTMGLISGTGRFRLTIEDEIINSEVCKYFGQTELVNNNLVEIKAYNDDFTYGYLDDTYPAVGFFKVSDFGTQVFGNDKVEFKYSYGRSMILRSENYVKKRLTFVGLSMYQQNLLKYLCNCQYLLISGTAYQLSGELTEKSKDESSEICDLQGDFVTVDQSNYIEPASEMVNDLEITNLFTV